jgi:hypothetical protein
LAEVLPAADRTEVPDRVGPDRRAGEGHLPLRSGGPGWARVQPLDLVHRLPLSRARRDITRIEVYECVQRRTIVGEWVRMRRI